MKLHLKELIHLSISALERLQRHLHRFYILGQVEINVLTIQRNHLCYDEMSILIYKLVRKVFRV